MTLISYISFPVENRFQSHHLKIDLNTNILYFKNKNGEYVVIDDLHQMAQDAGNANNMNLDIYQEELDRLCKLPVISYEDTKRKAELQDIISSFNKKAKIT